MKLSEIYSLGGQTMAVADFIEDNIEPLALTMPEDYPTLASKIATRLLKHNFQWSWLRDAMNYPRGCFNDGETTVQWTYHANPPQYRVIIRAPGDGGGGAYTLGYFRDHDIIDTINKHLDSALIKEGLGADVLAFNDYLDSKMNKEVADTRKYQRIAALLFKNGYVWIPATKDEPPHFKNGENNVTMSGHKYSRGVTFWTDWKESGTIHKRWALDAVDKWDIDKVNKTFRGENPYATR